MEIEVLTIFPEIFEGFKNSSLIGKACERSLLKLTLTDIRDCADPPHFKVDDTPYGGGAGMVLMPEPLARSIENAMQRLPMARRILLSASGTPFTQRKALEISRLDALILICGRYEGVDQRVVDLLVDEEVSLGDFVLMGGEVAAMAVIEATTRLLNGVLGNTASVQKESFSGMLNEGEPVLLEAPQYTRPAEFRGLKVPEVLLSGDHAKICAWREHSSLELTAKRRADLLPRGRPSR